MLESNGYGTRNEPKAKLVDIANVLYSVGEMIQRPRRADNTAAATAWLRVLYAAIAGRDK